MNKELKEYQADIKSTHFKIKKLVAELDTLCYDSCDLELDLMKPKLQEILKFIKSTYNTNTACCSLRQGIIKIHFVDRQNTPPRAAMKSIIEKEFGKSLVNVQAINHNVHMEPKTLEITLTQSYIHNALYTD